MKSALFFLFLFSKISVCGARYKTRPGLTYHYNHSHKEGASDENSRDSNAPNPSTQISGPITSAFPGLPTGPAAQGPLDGQSGLQSGPIEPVGSPGGSVGPMQSNVGGGMGEGLPPSANRADQGQVYQDSYVSFLNQTPGTVIFFLTFFYFCLCIVHATLVDNLLFFILVFF